MHHFFVTPSQVEEPYIYVEGQDVNHMKNVLRMKPGEQAGISDGNNLKYVCEVVSYEEGRATLRILEKWRRIQSLAMNCICFRDFPRETRWS